jgi:hypothetical protein
VRRTPAVLVLVVPLLVGCGSDYSGSPPGTVIDRGKRYVVVREDFSGKQVRHSTSKAVSRRCQVDKRWPDCA